VFSYNELKSATGCFHSSSKIGEGGFGCVYKVNIYISFPSYISLFNLVDVQCLRLFGLTL
jgi:serine/threonine protein kinase